MSDYLDSLLARSARLNELVQPRPISPFESSTSVLRSPFSHFSILETAKDESIFDEPVAAALEITGPATEVPQASPRKRRPRPGREYPDVTSIGPDPHLEQPVLMTHRVGRTDGTAVESPCTQPQLVPVQPEPYQVSEARAQSESRGTKMSQQRASLGQGKPVPTATLDTGADTIRTAAEPMIQPDLEVTTGRTVIERIVQQVTSLPISAAGSSDQDTPPRDLIEMERSVSPANTIHPEHPVSPAEITLLQLAKVLPAPVIAQPQLKSYSRPGPRPTPEPEARSEPTVQVTIGRIEVRATPAATKPPKKQASTAPLMSLEDYLRQRNRGGQ